VQVARFFRGPADGAILTLPKEAISPVFVIPEFEPITVEYFYLLAGEIEDYFAYLYEEDLAQ
jgi:hypothetical protein